MKQPGPTGDFPAGKLNPSDEGGLKVGIRVENGVVVMGFGTPVAWIGFGPDDADRLIEMIRAAAQKARRQKAC